MKSISQKKQSFEKQMNKLKKEGTLKEEKKSFFNVLKKAIKQKPFSH